MYVFRPFYVSIREDFIKLVLIMIVIFLISKFYNYLNLNI